MSVKFLRFETTDGIRLAGIHKRMTFDTHDPASLWREFGPRVPTIAGRIGKELFAVEVYQQDMSAPFEKWAAVRVLPDQAVQSPLEVLDIPPCLYAVFLHAGSDDDGAATYQYIHREWLPESGYTLAQAPHMAVMGAGYKRGSPDSEEEIWLPIKKVLG